MSCNDQTIQRYYRILTSYLAMTKEIETCNEEDKDFYQQVCLLFANKVKNIQAELADKGFILCQGKKVPVICKNALETEETK
jgi:hypothetical protein